MREDEASTDPLDCRVAVSLSVSALGGEFALQRGAKTLASDRASAPVAAQLTLAPLVLQHLRSLGTLGPLRPR